MKYTITNTYEDKDILLGVSDYKVARWSGLSPAFINLLRNGKRIATMKTYELIKGSVLRNKGIDKIVDKGI